MPIVSVSFVSEPLSSEPLFSELLFSPPFASEPFVSLSTECEWLVSVLNRHWHSPQLLFRSLLNARAFAAMVDIHVVHPNNGCCSNNYQISQFNFISNIFDREKVGVCAWTRQNSTLGLKNFEEKRTYDKIG